MGVPHETVSLADPAQVAPQAFGAGLLHSRVRIFVPTPQVTEHAQKAVQAPQLPLTIGLPHDRVSDMGPEHCVPQEFPGVHVRLLV